MQAAQMNQAGSQRTLAVPAGQLGGLVLSQLKREGSPLILCGRNGGYLDMRTMVSLYTAPDNGPYGWDLARHYRIPTFTAACTDAKIFDAQAAGETALTLFEKTLNGAFSGVQCAGSFEQACRAIHATWRSSTSPARSGPGPIFICI